MKKIQDKQIEGIIYKGKEIEPYESFYHNTSDKFFRGQLGGGISRCCKCDDSLAVIEVVYEEVFHQRSSIGEKNGI